MSALDFSPPRACVVGVSGTNLTDEEQELITKLDPFGLILFARNINTPDQVQRLCASFRACVSRPTAPVLIDQEGGRVQRLRPPHWRDAPAAARFGELYALDPQAAREASYLNARLLAAELLSVGVTVDCAPVLDVPVSGAHDVIGSRAFSGDPAIVSILAAAAAAGFLDGGVVPIVKHVPGHGRAGVDSHLALPVVEDAHATLQETDFVPFIALKDAPYAMSAHVVYADIDPDRPATQSPKVIQEVIRGEIGFKGCLFTDDLSMDALSGSIAERAALALEAGCDIALHCNGNTDEMRSLMDVVPRLEGEVLTRAFEPVMTAKSLLSPDIAGWQGRLNELLQTLGPQS